MAALPPQVASEIASLVYTIRGNIEALDVLPATANHFKFNLNNVQRGTTGGFFWRKETGFVLIGQGHSQLYKNDHVITIRGTALNAADILTDVTCNTKGCDTGSAVHTGFQSTFASFRSNLAAYIRRPEVLNGNGIIHCVGHSLGGALASLVADWVKAEFNKTVYLYTFGCPRVGKKDFAINSNDRIDKVFRCVHGNDPVPKVPVWPFTHMQGPEYLSSRAQGINIPAHYISSYISTTQYNDWNDIYSQHAGSIKERVVLSYQNRMQASYSTFWADRLAKALLTLLVDAGYSGTVATLQAMGTSIGTVYDLMAKTVAEIAQIEGHKGQVEGVLGHMMVFAGVIVALPVIITYPFIKMVFDKAIGRLMKDARTAIKGS